MTLSTNGEDYFAEFHFNAFRFSSATTNTIYVHCEGKNYADRWSFIDKDGWPFFNKNDGLWKIIISVHFCYSDECCLSTCPQTRSLQSAFPPKIQFLHDITGKLIYSKQQLFELLAWRFPVGYKEEPLWMTYLGWSIWLSNLLIALNWFCCGAPEQSSFINRSCILNNYQNESITIHNGIFKYQGASYNTLFYVGTTYRQL